MSDTNQINDIKRLFSNYLEEHSQRKTAERFIVLEEVYSRDDHFDAESLYTELKNKEQEISRATVYNTLDLLVSCDLVTKHQFGRNQSQYEKSYGFKQHDHIICVECNKVVEFCDPRIYEITNMMGKLNQFKISHHSLHLYGLCEACLQNQKDSEQKNR